jgi:hypothetical protein
VLRRFAGTIDAAMIDRIAQAMVDSMVTALAELESAADFRAEVFDASRETASEVLEGVLDPEAHVVGALVVGRQVVERRTDRVRWAARATWSWKRTAGADRSRPVTASMRPSRYFRVLTWTPRASAVACWAAPASR